MTAEGGGGGGGGGGSNVVIVHFGVQARGGLYGPALCQRTKEDGVLSMRVYEYEEIKDARRPGS